MSLWVRSRRNYKTLTESKTLILPSGRQLQCYKNVVPEEAGKTAYFSGYLELPNTLISNGWSGGIHHDETKYSHI